MRRFRRRTTKTRRKPAGWSPSSKTATVHRRREVDRGGELGSEKRAGERRVAREACQMSGSAGPSSPGRRTTCAPNAPLLGLPFGVSARAGQPRAALTCGEITAPRIVVVSPRQAVASVFRGGTLGTTPDRYPSPEQSGTNRRVGRSHRIQPRPCSARRTTAGLRSPTKRATTTRSLVSRHGRAASRKGCCNRPARASAKAPT